MLFTSDNWAGVHPTIMDAMVKANGDPVPAYGADRFTEDAIAAFGRVFERDVKVKFVATGSAANSLALACMSPPWGAILTYKDGHIHVDECGAPEFFTGGAKVIPVPGEQGKLTPEGVKRAVEFFFPAMTHHVVPAVLSITQGTETGTIYTAAEVKALCDLAKSYGLAVHMDGARFSNACAASADSAADMTWRAGVDVLTFGATKNGCMVAEAIVLFDDQYEHELSLRQKRAGQGFSKNRFLGAQWSAFFEDDLWLKLARHANEMADRLAAVVDAHPDCEVIYPPQINEVFPIIPDDLVVKLKQVGAAFYDWVQPDDPFDRQLRRLVTSYATTEEDIRQFEAALKKYG